ncbi:response regulator [Desertivirga brevis]|uniref:response regulator n=1 Tax=Desertivirga brevis TaxID=2810310 RepID=UPI001A956A5C|nr:response regulator [Pedobacter sp. SYSU D00873]
MKSNIILLIEDDELDIISVERSLNRLDTQFELYTAFNGIEALSLLRGEGGIPPVYPDIVLLDLNMPKMNGIEFLKIIRNDPSLKDLKVFVMTTSGDVSDREATSKLGVLGYLIKPLNFTDNRKNPNSMDAFVQFHLGRILNNNLII